MWEEHDEELKKALVTVASWVLFVRGEQIDPGEVYGEILRLAWPDRVWEFRRLCEIAGIKNGRSVRYYTEKMRRKLYGGE